jgi:hypothetical protein
MTTSSRFIKYIIKGIILFAFFGRCVQPADSKLAKAKLEKEIRKDSILLGIRFGDTQKEFRAKCFELNKRHLTTEGAGYSVRYLFSDSLVHDKPTAIQLLFVPTFNENDTLTDMDLKFSYLGWAPWNRQFQSDSLKSKVIELLMHWYGGNKFVTAHARDNEITVKVDGNRRMLIYEDPPQNVMVRINDILHSRRKHIFE